MLDRLALILVVIGALNWGSIGLFQFDIVAWAFGGAGSAVSRVIYTLVALAGIWCISLVLPGPGRNPRTQRIVPRKKRAVITDGWRFFVAFISSMG